MRLSLVSFFSAPSSPSAFSSSYSYSSSSLVNLGFLSFLAVRQMLNPRPNTNRTRNRTWLIRELTQNFVDMLQLSGWLPFIGMPPEVGIRKFIFGIRDYRNSILIQVIFECHCDIAMVRYYWVYKELEWQQLVVQWKRISQEINKMSSGSTNFIESFTSRSSFQTTESVLFYWRIFNSNNPAFSQIFLHNHTRFTHISLSQLFSVDNLILLCPFPSALNAHILTPSILQITQKTLFSSPSLKMNMIRYITATSFCVALSAFLFQTAVLYPWHKSFSDELTSLTQQVHNLNTEVSRIEKKRQQVAVEIEARAINMMLLNNKKK